MGMKNDVCINMYIYALYDMQMYKYYITIHMDQHKYT